MTSKTGKIYISTSNTSKKSYIGQALNLKKRIKRHKNDFKINECHFYRAIKLYGWDDFKWEVLYNSIPQNQLNNMERWCISNYDTFNNGYNSTTGGGQGTVISEETKQKISKSNTGKKFTKEHKNRISISLSGKAKNSPVWNKGKKTQEETRNKISKNHADISGKNNPMYGKNHKYEARQKISESKKNKKLSIEHRAKISKSNQNKILSLDHKNRISKSNSKSWKIIKLDNTIEIITNLNEYCRVNNLSSSHMSSVASGKLKQHKGYKVERI